MGISAFLRKYNEDCSCDMESLGNDVPYHSYGRPAYKVFFTEHFITEMRLAMQYDRDIYGTRRFKMSKPEYDFWGLFELYNDMSGTPDYKGTLDIACGDLDNWLHREIQNLPHDQPADASACNI